MRQKLRNRHRAKTPVHADPTPITVGDASRQLALSETGDGWQHRVIEIVVALTSVLLMVPLRPFLGSGSKDRRDQARRRP
jgi:hypothetical protein